MDREILTPGEPGSRNEQLKKQLNVEEVEPVDDTELYAVLGED
ncbi:hypothetical protein OG455_38800 [Kitasatospora sp. NBC_01287]|nr:hypothetical protein [Kitasatospora sp. NBC_01287]MCX4751387.1 hypothetical protein [Kitasatospora sp. NBC_01287]